MSRPSRIAMASLTIAAVAVLSACLFSGGAGASLSKGKKMPALSVKTTSGKTFDVSKRKGKVVLVDFWATWCPPCKQEIPHLQALHGRYGSKGLNVLGVSIGEGKDKPAGYAKDQKISYAVGYSSQDEASRIAQAFDFHSIPTTYIVDKKGVIRFAMTGFQPGSEKEMEEVIKKLLAEK